MNWKELKKKHPRFIYQDYSVRISKNNLEILFSFKIEPNLYFKPKIIIKNVKKELLSQGKLDNLVFHLGLIEMISYWKATCSPEIIIKTGSLTREQVKWWQDLIVEGLGQFFYENKIPFQRPRFTTSGPRFPRLTISKSARGNLVGVGGGKDSVVTLEELRKKNKDIQCFSLNPTESALRIMKLAGCNKPIIVKRIIDGKLLGLNRKGFLNGHTPFSAYLAFLGVLLSSALNYKYIVVSNEKSSNEGNVKYLGRIVNHQWSKSSEFEQKFKEYSRKYLVRGVEYFSYLRPLYEIQIARLFSKYPKYFPVFLSCNEAYKTYSGTRRPTKKWCGKCSKCLFVFSILYPFLEDKEIVKIFDRNLFKDKSLLPLMQQLIGERGIKPFECVGTRKESLVAFYLSWKKISVGVNPQPVLLKYLEDKILPKHLELEKELRELEPV